MQRQLAAKRGDQMFLNLPHCHHVRDCICPYHEKRLTFRCCQDMRTLGNIQHLLDLAKLIYFAEVSYILPKTYFLQVRDDDTTQMLYILKMVGIEWCPVQFWSTLAQFTIVIKIKINTQVFLSNKNHKDVSTHC
jgi:hypothetical protein